MATLAEVNVRIGSRIEGLQRGLRQAERELLRSGRAMSQLGGDLTRSLTLPIAAAGFAALKFSSDLETAFTKTEVLTEVTAANLEAIKASVNSLSGPLAKTKKELADAAFFIEGAGLKGAEGLRALEQSGKGSAIGLGKQTEVAKVAGAAIAAYGDQVLNSSLAIDQLLQTAREGNAEAEDLAPVLGNVLPIASKLGVSFAEVGANIATFTKLGAGASTAVDSLKSVLSNILKPSEQAKKELAGVGLSMDDIKKSIKDKGLANTLIELQTLFGDNSEALGRIFGDVTGLTNVLAVSGNQAGNYAEALKRIENSAGEVDKAFEKVADDGAFKAKQALVLLQNRAEEFGAIMLPIATGVAGAVVSMATAFAALPKPIQEVSVVGAGLLAATGPLVSLFGNLKTVTGTVGIAFRSLQGGLSIAADTFNSTREVIAATGGTVTSLTGIMPAAAAAWKGFNTVVKASIIGAAVAAVVALGFAVHSLTSELSAAEKAQRAVNEVSLEAEKNIVAERLEAQRLTAILSDNAAGYDEKKKALDQLNSIAPEYFQGLSVEKSSVQDITKAYDGYIANLLRAAKAQAAQQKLVELEKRRLELTERLNELKKNDFGIIDAVVLGTTGGGSLRELAEVKKELESLDAQQKAFAKTFIETAPQINKAVASINTTPPVPATGGLLAKATPAGTGAAPAAAQEITIPVRPEIIIPDLLPFDTIESKVQDKVAAISASLALPIKPAKGLEEAFAIIDNKAILLGDSFNPVAEKLNLVTSAIVTLVENGIQPGSASFDYLIEQQTILQEQLAASASEADKLKAAYEALTPVQSALIQVAEQVGAAMIQSSEEGVKSMEEFASAIGNAARKAISAFIAQAVAGVVSKTLLTLGPLGLAIAPIAGAAAAALFNSVVPKFAQGGLVTGPTLALIGEGPGTTSNNPEVVAPLDKLQKMLMPAGVSGPIQVFGRLDGTDILISSERSDQRRKRTRGF